MYHPPCRGYQINKKEMLKQLKEPQKGKVIVLHSSTNFSTSQK
jgi:hypothetical protein